MYNVYSYFKNIMLYFKNGFKKSSVVLTPAWREIKAPREKKKSWLGCHDLHMGYIWLCVFIGVLFVCVCVILTIWAELIPHAQFSLEQTT